MRYFRPQLLKLVSSIRVRDSLLCLGAQMSCEFVVNVAYRISGVAMTTCEAGRVTPTTGATTTGKSRGTVRYAATAPLIGDAAEGNTTIM